jgi:hypothetical protein
MTQQQQGSTNNFQVQWLPGGEILITTEKEFTSSETLEISEAAAPTLDIVYGHDTSVDENNVRDFSGNWSGSATITGSGDAEKVRLKTGQNLESEDIDTSGTPVVRILKDKYQSGSGSVTVKYKTAATQGGLSGEGWTTYTVPFASSGWVKVRVEA